MKVLCVERDIFRLRASGYLRKPYERERLAEEFANLRFPTV